VKKPVKIGLWLLGLAMLGLLGLWLEHERAKARLAAFKADLIAKGEKLAIADHVPKLPPALSNAAPDFIAAANRLTELKAEWQPARMRMVAPGKARVTWRQAELPTNVESDIWPFIIAHVEDNRPLLAELAAALERPEMVFNLDYSKSFLLRLPHLSKARLAANTFANAVLVDLRTGQTNEAFTNLLVAVRSQRLFREPLLISQLVRFAGLAFVHQVTWEALQHSAWAEPDLHQWQREWEACELGDCWLSAISMERGMISHVFDECRAKPGRMPDFGINSAWPSPGSGSFFKSVIDEPSHALRTATGFFFVMGWTGWFSFPDERWMLENQQVWHEGHRRMIRQSSLREAEAWMSAKRGSLVPPPAYLRFLSSQALPAMDKAHRKLASAEAVRRLTVTAIALHRHRLKHGKFPESLSALVPEFLAEVPRDFMDGQPLRYRLEPDGQFRLWSVGEDFKDDGGDATTSGASSTNPFDWLKGRDWVWPQPANEAEVAAFHAELEAKRAAAAKPPPPMVPGWPGMIPPGMTPPGTPSPALPP